MVHKYLNLSGSVVKGFNLPKYSQCTMSNHTSNIRGHSGPKNNLSGSVVKMFNLSRYSRPGSKECGAHEHVVHPDCGTIVEPSASHIGAKEW